MCHKVYRHDPLSLLEARRDITPDPEDFKFGQRVEAVVSVLSGERTTAQAAVDTGVTQRCIQLWLQWVDETGWDALRTAPIPGRPSRLSPEQNEEVRQVLLEEPRLHGYPRWTRSTLADYIRTTYHIEYGADAAAKLARRLGLSDRLAGRRHTDSRKPTPPPPQNDPAASAAMQGGSAGFRIWPGDPTAQGSLLGDLTVLGRWGNGIAVPGCLLGKSVASGGWQRNSIVSVSWPGDSVASSRWQYDFATPVSWPDDPVVTDTWLPASIVFDSWQDGIAAPGSWLGDSVVTGSWQDNSVVIGNWEGGFAADGRLVNLSEWIRSRLYDISNRRSPYTTNRKPEQIKLIEDLLLGAIKRPDKLDYNVHDIFNGILYLNGTGCQWRNIPHDFPPWQTVYHYFDLWSTPDKDGNTVFSKCYVRLRQLWRNSHGKKDKTSFGIIDSKSIRNTFTALESGYDAGKKISGIKVHILVDTNGLPHAIYITSADVTDRDGALEMIGFNLDELSSVEKFLVDGGYSGEWFANEVKKLLPGAEVEVAKRSELHKFVVIPQRWIVERTFGWIDCHRRHWRNCERYLHTSLQMILMSFIGILLNRF